MFWLNLEININMRCIEIRSKELQGAGVRSFIDKIVMNNNKEIVRIEFL